MIRLKIPPEPLEIKERIISIRSTLMDEGRKSIRWDNLAVWAFNMLPKYLWKYWKKELMREGITWQDFLSILKYETKYIRSWAFGYLSWRELMEEIIESLEFALGYGK